MYFGKSSFTPIGDERILFSLPDELSGTPVVHLPLSMPVSKTEYILSEMRTGKLAKMQFAHPDDGHGADGGNGALEIVFEDGTLSPFAITFSRGDIQHALLPLKGSLHSLLVRQGDLNLLALPASTDFVVRVDEQGRESVLSNNVEVFGDYVDTRKRQDGYCRCGKRVSGDKTLCFSCSQVGGAYQV
jgi:hypothetical protein